MNNKHKSFVDFYATDKKLYVNYKPGTVPYYRILICLGSLIVCVCVDFARRTEFNMHTRLSTLILLCFLNVFLLLCSLRFGYSVFYPKQTILKKNGRGYYIGKNWFKKPDVINEIIKIRVIGRYDFGYLTAVSTAAKNRSVLIDQLPIEDADRLIDFLTTEMKVPCKIVDV